MSLFLDEVYKDDGFDLANKDSAIIIRDRGESFDIEVIVGSKTSETSIIAATLGYFCQDPHFMEHLLRQYQKVVKNVLDIELQAAKKEADRNELSNKKAR